MRIPRFLIAAAAVASCAPAAFAHGGQYKPPDGGKGPGGIPTDSEILNPTVPVPTPPDRRTMTPWERWWDVNKDRWLDLRKRLRTRDRRDTATGGKEEPVDPFHGPGEGGAPADPGEDPAVTREFLEREVLPVLTRCLRDADPEVRSAAALALGKIGFPRSFLDLRGSLGDPERDVREAAVLGLGMTGEPMAAETLGRVLLDPRADERARGNAALALGFLGGPEAGEALLAFLDPASDSLYQGGIRRRPETCCCALAALGLVRHSPATAVLRDIALKRVDSEGWRAEPVVRSFALVALAKSGDPEAIPAGTLLGFLEEDRESIRQAAALALGLAGRPDDARTTAALEKAALGDRDFNVRSLATMSLARLGGDGARKALRRLLEKASRADLPFTTLAVGIAGDAASAPLLRSHFRESRDPSLRAAAALGLGLMGDRALASEIRGEAFGRGDREYRRHCMTALGLMGDEGAAPDLRKVLAEERDPFVKIGAGVALGLLKDLKTLPLLAGAARGATSVLARGHACRVLGMVGNREAAKVLLALVRNPREESFVRMYAVTGLGILSERGEFPILSTPGFDTNPEIRVGALDALAEMM